MKILLVTLLVAASAAKGEVVNLCFNYECRAQMQLEFEHSELRRAARLFVEVEDAASEREAIRHAVAVLSGVAASRTPIANDKAGNVADEGVDGRMDCIDHSRTTTEYLRLLERRHWMRFHRVLSPAERAPLLLNVHWGARIEETQTGAQFVIDTWFRPNGFPAAVFALKDWRKGAAPSALDSSIATPPVSTPIQARSPDG